MTIRTFPLASGIRRDVDIQLLPDGLLNDAVNVELDRAGRMVVRPNYTAIASTVYGSGTLVAFDLFTLNGRLFAIGDAHSWGFPSDIFGLVETGAAARWRPTSGNNTNSPRMPRATKVRELARPADVPDGVENWGCAAFGGYVCLVFNPVGDPSGDPDGYVHVVSAANDQTLVFQGMDGATDNPRHLLRCIALSDRFLIIGTNTAETALDLARFIPASDESVVDVAQDLVSGGSLTTYAVTRVVGSDEFVLSAQVGTNLITRRFNSSGVQQVEYSTIAVTTTQVVVEADSTANQVVIGYIDGSDSVWIAYNLTSGAQIATRTISHGSNTLFNIGIVRSSSTVVKLIRSVNDSVATDEDFVAARFWTPSTDTLGTSTSSHDLKMVSTPVLDGEIFFATQYGAATVGGTPNLLVSIGSENRDSTPQISKDFGVADVTSQLLPEIVLDSSTGKYYWANATANPDGTTTPQVTEFELNSTDRRQVAALGSLAYIAGGMPLVFDGRVAVESNFLVRPRIIQLSSSNSTGELISNAEYDYRLHWEWIDSENNLHLSPPSEIETITLGAAHDTVTAIVSTPHSLRVSRSGVGFSGSIACVLTRTLATLSTTAAQIFGRNVVDPPSSSLDSLTLLIFVEDLTGAQLFTVTFDSGSTGTDAIVTDINTVTTGRVTATNAGGAVLLTLDDEGEGNFLWVYGGGTANEILGFLDNESSEGTTTITKGENFQRAAVAYTNVGTIPGTFVTITDVRKDESDPIEDDDLIKQQPLYSSGVSSGAHHAPLPSDYIWAGRERVVLGHHRRSRFQVSKIVVPSEPAEFALEGFVGFQGQVTGDIEGIVVLGDSIILFTRREIWEVTGEGPGRNGVGEFFAARRISNAGGLVADGWRSLVETDVGVFFQRESSQLCLLRKGGGVEWVGLPIEDYLDLYPVIVAATYVASKHSVAFACTNSNGSDGGILRFDLDSNSWFFDDVGAVETLTEFEGRLAFVQSGIVNLQDAAVTAANVPVFNVDTNMFQGFSTLGWGQLSRVGALVSFRSDCVVRLYLSQDGTDFSTQIGEWTLTDATYSVGQRLTLLKDPPIQMLDSFALRVEVEGTAGEGVWLHAVAVDVDPSREVARRGGALNR